MGIFDGILGPVLDIGKSIAGNLFAEEQQEDSQRFNSAEAAAQRSFNSAEAEKARYHDYVMSTTKYQRTKEDLLSAGFNPLLAVYHGAQGAPGGASASGAAASSSPTSPIHSGGIAAGIQSATQASLNQAAEERTRAETDRVRAETKEIAARTETHPANVDRMRQEIRESEQRIEKIMAEVPHIRQLQHTSAAQAAYYGQQITNLKAEIPRIAETINNLKAMTIENLTRSGLNQANAKEIHQRIDAQLPQLEAILKNLQAQSARLGMPGKENEASAQQSFFGQWGAYLRSINPLNRFLSQVP